MEKIHDYAYCKNFKLRYCSDRNCIECGYHKRNIRELLSDLKQALDEKNELLQLCGVSASGERKRVTQVIKELKEENKRLLHQKNTITAKYAVCYSCLQEIKEIAEWEKEYWSVDISVYKKMINDISQKISEVLNERN